MSTSEHRAATGAHTTNGMPHGSTSLTPFLAIPSAAEAIEFYRNVFGARLIDATEMGGIIAHADLDFGTGHLQLGEPMPDYHLVASPEGEDDCYSTVSYTHLDVYKRQAQHSDRPPRAAAGGRCG